MAEYIEIDPIHFDKSPFQIIGREWMLVTAEKSDKVNTMTASWGGLGVMWGQNVAFVVIRPQRYTKEFMDGSDTFSLSFFDEKYKKELGYLGSVSGRDENKIENSGFSVVHEANTPYFSEAHTIIICKKLFAQAFDPENFIDETIKDKWYPQKDYHTLYIVAVEKILTKNK